MVFIQILNVKQFMVKTTGGKNKFNDFVGCDLIGSMLVFAILPLGFTADDIKEIT